MAMSVCLYVCPSVASRACEAWTKITKPINVKIYDSDGTIESITSCNLQWITLSIMADGR